MLGALNLQAYLNRTSLQTRLQKKKLKGVNSVDNKQNPTFQIRQWTHRKKTRSVMAFNTMFQKGKIY